MVHRVSGLCAMRHMMSGICLCLGTPQNLCWKLSLLYVHWLLQVLLPGVSEDMMSTSNDWALSKMGVDSHIRPAQRNKQWSSTLACDSEQHKCNNNVALKPASEDKQAAVVSPHLVSPSNKDKQQH